MSAFLKVFTYLIPTLILLPIALVLRPVLTTLPNSQWQVIQWLPFFIFFPGIFLSIRFNRSRVFYFLCIITLIYITLHWFWPEQKRFTMRASYSVMSLTLPLLLLFFVVIKEKGIFTIRGLARFIVIAIPIVVIIVMVHYKMQSMLDILNYRVFQHSVFALTPLPQSAIYIFVVSGFLLNGYLFTRPSAQSAAFFSVFLCVLILLHDVRHSAAALLYCSTSGLLLVIAVVQETYSMAYLDELTGLPGRRALQEQLQKLGNRYTVAMVDIDHFKAFNDSYGHDVGDQVLRMVAGFLDEVGLGGKAYRFGGEEFCLVFPGKPVGAATEELERMCETVAKNRFSVRKMQRNQTRGKSKKKKKLNVTISIGAAERDDDLKKPWTVLKAADKALYRAKSKGRNCVSI